jgi:hypothetical protein
MGNSLDDLEEFLIIHKDKEVTWLEFKGSFNAISYES